MCAATRDNSQYKLETVARACTILHHFTDAQQSLSLSEVVERTGFERTIVFRILEDFGGRRTTAPSGRATVFF